MSIADEKEKKFVIKLIFKDVKNLFIEEDDITEIIGPKEKHFGVEWRLRLLKNDRFIEFYLDCTHTDHSCNWSIETKFDAFANGKKIKQRRERTFSEECLSNDSYTYIQLLEYEHYSTNDRMPVEFHVTIKKMTGFEKKKQLRDFDDDSIKKMTGFEKKKLRNFDDDAAKEHSDVMLKIGDQKFYVCKMYLSLHSSYFKALFSGNFSESGKSEIELKDVDPEHLQNFLELIYGESVIKENTISEQLKLADFFDSKTAIRRCEEFLLNRSEQSLKFKFQMAIKYRLDALKIKCLGEMVKSTNFVDFSPENASDFSPEVWKELYDKCASFV